MLDLTIAEREPRIELEPAQIGKAEGLGCDIDHPHRLPEPESKPDARDRRTAQANRQGRIVRSIRALRTPKRGGPDRQREKAAPAHIGNRIGEMAMAGGILLSLRALRADKQQEREQAAPDPSHRLRPSWSRASAMRCRPATWRAAKAGSGSQESGTGQRQQEQCSDHPPPRRGQPGAFRRG
ncbi:hypothetical protein E4T56_gene15638 [Termitomyces sp. T112]|nr:hypothetical protein E4T56_gene15638 [Termitomyces sp. T112]